MSIYNYATGEETYIGCVLDTFEKNWYDDSDFYATVWDEAEQEFKSVWYASTRFYCTTGARIDASEDLKSAHRLWCMRMERISKARAKWNHRKRLISYARECRVTNYLQLRELENVCSEAQFGSCIRLLRTKKFRSAFRESLCNQLREWMNTEPDKRTHSRPFSPRQADFI